MNMKSYIVLGLIFLFCRECYAQKTVDLSAVSMGDLKEARKQIFQKYAQTGDIPTSAEVDILSRSETGLKKITTLTGTVAFSKMPVAVYDNKLKSLSFSVQNYMRERDNYNEFVRILNIAYKADTAIITRLISKDNYTMLYGVKRTELQAMIKK
jgi:tetrahydromethanopterin S-methyltransferase subunit E